MPDTRAVFVLRLWRSPGMPAGIWYSEVEQVPSARMLRFADLTALFAHLTLQLAQMERDRADEENREEGSSV